MPFGDTGGPGREAELAAFAESKGLPQEQLGTMLGSSWYINNFENWFNLIYYEDAVRFAEILEIAPEELLDGYTKLCKQGDSNRIKKIRAEYGVSQKAFAEFVGVSRSTVGIWEAKIKNSYPQRDAYRKLMAIAAEKGVDLSVSF